MDTNDAQRNRIWKLKIHYTTDDYNIDKANIIHTQIFNDSHDCPIFICEWTCRINCKDYRSSDLQAEYDRLKNEMLVAESIVQSFLSKRRDVAIEKKEAKQEKDEARKFQAMKAELVC